MLQRRTWFGMPPGNPPPSSTTVRLVPLTQGIQPANSFPLLPPGSGVSMVNFLPLEGGLTPRSRLSSINTIRTLSTISGIFNLIQPTDDGRESILWVSKQTTHAEVDSLGSFSQASFVSAFGLGVGTLQSQNVWQYAQIFSDQAVNNLLLAVGQTSYDTILVLAEVGGVAVVSYLTSAPKAKSLGVFDNYVIAFNTTGSGGPFTTRAQWCQRGTPSNWTGEGSGFEDVLQMTGEGKAVWPTADGRFYLFSTREVWYGVGAAYPAQFQFYPLDTHVGCEAPRTIQDTDAGTIFLGSDKGLRLIPRGGGPSQVISSGLQSILRHAVTNGQPNNCWGVYDWNTKLYHLFVDPGIGTAVRPFVLNVTTGEWGEEAYSVTPSVGIYARARGSGGPNEGVFFGNSTGTLYSTNSVLGTDSGSLVTATWRSAPIAADLPGDYKQLTEICLDYRGTSRSTVTVKISQDGNTYEATGKVLSLASAPIAGRVRLPVYAGGLFPSIELTSGSTGFSIHRLDATVSLQGRG